MISQIRVERTILIHFVLDCIMQLKYRVRILAHEGRLLEAIPKMERGVASRGAGSQPSPREAPGPRPPGTTTRTRGARCDRSGCSPKRKLRGAAGEGSAGPEPKIATVERREASVSRETQDASQGVWRAALRHAPRVPEHPSVISALRHPSFGCAKPRCKTRAQKRAAGTTRRRQGYGGLLTCPPKRQRRREEPCAV